MQLCVTSPPYPMVSMWDGLFSRDGPDISSALARGEGARAWEMMHESLDAAWKDAYRGLTEGGIACVNIGDATRSVNGLFRVYPNHVRVERAMEGLGFVPLPEILWRKTSNKPNKFMGSGMLPPGAYVTQEHEYILIFRKGGRRSFEGGSRARSSSAYFWEERNSWFSDLWDGVRGERQALRLGGRTRGASYPLEIPYRLTCMFSVRGDTVYDPFLGTGTTVLAAMATARNSVSLEIDSRLEPVVRSRLLAAVEMANSFNIARLRRHAEFASRTSMGYRNENYGFPVKTSQERQLEVPRLRSVTETGRGVFEVEYADEPFVLDDPGQ